MVNDSLMMVNSMCIKWLFLVGVLKPNDPTLPGCWHCWHWRIRSAGLKVWIFMFPTFQGPVVQICTNCWLVVWSIFLFSSIVGMMIQSDFHIFKRDWNHQPVFHAISCWLPWNIKMNQPRFFYVGIAPTRQRLESLRSADTHAMHSLVLMLNMWFKWWVL